jgi:hypothetical protein
MWRGGLGAAYPFRPFRLPVPHYPLHAPFQHPARRTHRADLPQWAHGGSITISPTKSCASDRLT